MIYEAIYSKECASVAKKKMINALKGDHYYAMQYDNKYGTRIVKRDSDRGCWLDYYIRYNKEIVWEGKELNDIPDDITDTVKYVSWTSCSGNFAEIILMEDGTVKIRVNSRRHGIPDIVNSFKSLSPESILKYDTQEPSWAWYDTIDDKYEDHLFVGIAGPLNNIIGIPEVSRESPFSHMGNRGACYIRAYKTDRIDKNGDKIYINQEGIEFVWQVRLGSPERADFGRIVSPNYSPID